MMVPRDCADFGQVQSYFIREIYTVCYLLATCWPAVYGQEFMRKNIATVAAWVVSCVAMSAFTLLPAIKAEDVRLMYVQLSLLLMID